MLRNTQITALQSLLDVDSMGARRRLESGELTVKCGGDGNDGNDKS